MKLFKQIHLISRLDQLIRMKATGDPKSLARRLEISERHIYRLIKDLKEMGFPVKYCSSRNSYIYEGEVKIRFEIIVNDNEALMIRGGRNKFI